LEEYTMPEDRDGILFTNIIKRTNNVPSILLGFDFNKLAIEGLFRKIIARYDDPVYARDEYDQDDYMLTAYWHAFTKTDILLELNLSKIEYELPGRDGDYGQIMAGLKGQITSKIEGAIKAGYQDRTYKDSDEKYDEAVFEIDALWKISEDKTMDIKYLKTAKESLILGNNYYKVNRIYLDYSKNNPIRGILYGAGGFYENDDFPFTDNSTLREDDVFMIFVSAGFRFNSWLTLQAKYRYLDRNSNYDEQDYQQNVITCFATLQL
ncbi:MAG: outer membrane beta-barrel protein, partial [Candidatus Aureabacteria bacterium]|nr:outer membrane beta-barrel protein [Candidatus Auribacterota bacterium]